MKLVIDERVKHRLIGLAVILSIGAIFAPAIMKKSSQRLDGNMNVSVELPPKPMQPDVAMGEKNEMFKKARVAHVELPEVTQEQPLPSLAKAEPLSHSSDVNSRTVELANQTFAQDREPPSDLDSVNFAREDQVLTPGPSAPVVNTTNVAVVHKIAKAESFLPNTKAKALAKNNKTIKSVVNAKLSLAKPKPVLKPVAKKLTKNTMKSVTKGRYAVQLATFSQLNNANSLISRLKGKGYQATYSKVKTREGMVYKVLVGKVQKREQAQLLQKQLASAMQIRGFIVATEQG